jgi:phospholipid/cholesterol/gamma-HCH transport system substrate-binding protein
MEAEARYTWVGAGVLALLAALVVALVWLKNVGGKGEFNYYVAHFEHQSLEGLDIGADVTLRGIKVGRVVDYELAGGKFNRVRVRVRVDARAPLRTNTVAVVSRNFVTGIAAIALVTREPPGPPLEEVPDGESYPVIAEGRSEMDEISGRVSQLGEMASVTLTSVNQLLSAENRDDTMAAIRNLRDLSAGLNQRLGALDRTLERVGTAAGNVGIAARQLGQSGERTAGVAERIGERLDVTLVETTRAVEDARRAIAQIATATNAVQQQTVATARRLEGAAGNLDHQFDAAVAELRLSVEAATRTLDRLRDPRAALLGPQKSQLGPGEQ